MNDKNITTDIEKADIEAKKAIYAAYLAKLKEAKKNTKKGDKNI